MTDLNTLAPNYRRAQQRWPNAPTIMKCYEALVVCFSGSTHGLVEHVKSFIESVCHTIIVERDKTIETSTPTTTDLLVVTLDSLGLRNMRGADQFDKVLSGFNKLSDALGEMRNKRGPIAHGRDGFLDAVSVDHARVFLHVGDAILSVILNALEGKQPDPRVTREPYENFPHLNARIDRAANMQVRIDEDDDLQVAIFSVATGSLGDATELRVVPSRLLYGIDREAYVEALEATEPAIAETEADADDGKQEVAAPEPMVTPTYKTVVEGRPITTLVPMYSGALDKIRSDLEAFLVTEGIKLTEADVDADQLIDSLLATAEQNMALDWKIRNQIQARIKVACKRVLTRFGYAPQKAATIATRMVTWLREHVSDEVTDSLASSTSGNTA